MNGAQAEVMAMRRPVQRVVLGGERREGSTGGLVRRLPCTVRRTGSALRSGPQLVVAPPPEVRLERVWAVAETLPKPVAVATGPTPAEKEQAELAFYRKYTEALLRRYLRLSVTAGRVPSVMGRELFQGNVTHCRTHTMEDVVIFCMDMESRLARLDKVELSLITRIALQQYRQSEAAGMLGITLRSAVRQYGQALDRMTKMLLAAGMLARLKSCQEGEEVEIGVSA
jgi:hypothetical protein